MSRNANLHKAKKVKNDEFYTKYEDIDKEIQHYRDKLKGLIVYCPCDDFRWSNFVKYFKDNFEYYGLKGLVATNYDIGDGAWKYEYDGKTEHVERLQGNGDFRSEECIEFLKEADVVVTNPPFSLFREYIKQLMDYNKKFIVLGNMNSILCKEIFPYVKNNLLWWGVSIHSGDRKFYVPENYPLDAAGCGIDENGRRFIRVKGVRWWTNIENKNREIPLDLYKRYSSEYQKFDEFDAINVNKTTEIPMDYDGVMGVPITFFDKYCPEQFEIVDGANRYLIFDSFGTNEKVKLNHGHSCNIDGKATYFRILIRKRNA